MNSFKLLHLPWLAFQNVMKNVDFIALFNLSRVSKRMFLKIKLTRRKILRIELLLRDVAHLVKITDEKGIEGEDTVFKLNFFFKRDVTDDERVEKMILKAIFGGQEILIGEQRDYHDTFPGFLGQINENFFGFLHCLKELFVSPAIFLIIDKTLLFEKFLANLVGLNILSVIVVEKLDDNDSPWSEQEVAMLLDYTKPTYQLCLECPLTSDFNDRSVLNYPRVRIKQAKWLKIEDLMTVTCSTIVLYHHNFTENDLKQYIQHWLLGNNPSLTRFRCGKLRTTPDWNEILENVEYSKWDEKRRSRYHIYNSIDLESILDCKEGLDFERSDGKLASVFQNSEYFCMAVWHHRFH